MVRVVVVVVYGVTCTCLRSFPSIIWTPGAFSLSLSLSLWLESSYLPWSRHRDLTLIVIFAMAFYKKYCTRCICCEFLSPRHGPRIINPVSPSFYLSHLHAVNLHLNSESQLLNKDHQYTPGQRHASTYFTG